MFGTPVFFSIEQLPANIQFWFKLNLVGNFIGMVRDLVIYARLAEPLEYALCFIASYVVSFSATASTTNTSR